MAFYRGKSARVRAARMIVWAVLTTGTKADEIFTSREFYVKHKGQLDSRISKQVPGASVEAVVKGALRGLSRKGFLVVSKAGSGGTAVYARNVYMPQTRLLGLTYGQALVEAQRRRIG